MNTHPLLSELALLIELQEEEDLLSLLKRDLQRFYDDPEEMEKINDDISKCNTRINQIERELTLL